MVHHQRHQRCLELRFPQLNPADLEEILKVNKTRVGKLEIGKRIKFSIKKDELDGLIKELDESGIMLSRLRTSRTAIYDQSTQTASRTSTKLCLFLNRIREHILSLHSALHQGWMSGCHPQHRVCLYLDGNSAPLRKMKIPIEFKLALPDPESSPTNLTLEETRVAIMDDDVSGAISSFRYVHGCFNGHRIRNHWPWLNSLSVS